MAVSSRKGSSRASRKILWLGIAVIVACILYSFAWYYAASEIRSRVAAFADGQQRNGLTLECGGMEVKGFPFRFELFCSKPGFADLNRGGSVEAEALRTAAQVYAPWHVVWEADGPLAATLADGQKLSLDWKSLQSSLQLKAGGLERSSISAEGLSLSMPPEGNTGVLTATAAHGEAHARQNGEDLDMALLLKDVALTPPGVAALPLFSASLDATLAGKAGALDGRIRGDAVMKPSKGELRRIVADFGEGRIATITGPFEIDDQGRISGRLSVEAEKFVEWRPLLEGAMPDNADSISMAMGAIKGMADDKGTVKASIVIDEGQVLLGFIPLGIELPPIR